MQQPRDPHSFGNAKSGLLPERPDRPTTHNFLLYPHLRAVRESPLPHTHSLHLPSPHTHTHIHTHTHTRTPVAIPPTWLQASVP